MSGGTREIIQVCHSLSEDRLAELVIFARSLLAKQTDAGWEDRLVGSHSSLVLGKFIRESAVEDDESFQANYL
jgi:hypothetical protein